MNIRKLALLAAASAALALAGRAAPLTANFADYPNAPVGFGQVDLDTLDANTWFNDHYGITFENAYLYADSRDTFDGLGVANDSQSPAAAIYFADGTNFVTIDWVTINSSDIYVSAFDIHGVLLDSFFHDGNGSGSVTLLGADIRKLVWHDSGGTVGLSTLSYDFDGVTDGTNNDIPDGGTTVALLGLALGGLVCVRRKLN